MKWVLLSAIFLFCTASYGQFLKRQKNQLDENGKRKGLWVTYWDEEEKLKMSVAKFKDGYEVGKSKEYFQNENLRLKFRYQKNRIRAKYYSADGKLEKKGWAVIEYNIEDVHYYWQGKWKYYNEKRKVQSISFYENGKKISLEY